MKKLKTQRGITLIALIITIIVMLILVAVTVTVALNGGLFKTAKQATSETDVEKEKELLLEVVMGAMGKNGKVDFSNIGTDGVIKEKGELDGNNNLPVTTKSGRKYTITERGSIILDENAGGGEEPPPTGGEEPETLEAGLYSEDGILTYRWDDLLNDGILTVTDGSLRCNDKSSIQGKLVISNDVTSIANYQFQICTSLTSVTIPNSVTSIGNYVFASCVSLKEINVSENNSNYSSDNGVLYNKDKTTLILYPESKTDSSFTIPNSVTSIVGRAFSGCTGLTTITIPNSVTSIGAYEFEDCSSLISVTIEGGDNEVSLGSDTFDGCLSLTEVTIGDGITSISDRAFAGCTALTTITIPDTVTSIGSAAFSGCESLTAVTIPDKVTVINWAAFNGCEGLTSLTIGNSVTSIGKIAFQDCTGLTSVTIPDSVTSVGDSAFSNCTSLTATILGNNVTIESNAFNSVPLVYYNGTVPSNKWGAIDVQPLPSGT